MDLWIRSQDRKILKKVNKLYIATYSEEQGYGIYDLSYDEITDLDDCDIPLGFYETKERALEILDDIQKSVIGYISETKMANSLGGIIGSTSAKTTFYQMPEE